MNWKPVAVFAALVAGTLAVIHHREEIMLKLGIESVHPEYYRAVDLAQSARSLDRYQSNIGMITQRLRVEGGTIDEDGWKAERKSERTFAVHYRSKVGERPVEYDFDVDVARREVTATRDDPGRPDAELGSPR